MTAAAGFDGSARVFVVEVWHDENDGADGAWRAETEADSVGVHAAHLGRAEREHGPANVRSVRVTTTREVL